MRGLWLIGIALNVITDGESKTRSVINLSRELMKVIRKTFLWVCFHKLARFKRRFHRVIDEASATHLWGEMSARSDLKDFTKTLLHKVCLDDTRMLFAHVVPRLSIDVEIDGIEAQNLWIKIVVHSIRDHHDDVVLVAKNGIEGHVTKIGTTTLDKGTKTSTWILCIVDRDAIAGRDIEDLLGATIKVKDLAITDARKDKRPTTVCELEKDTPNERRRSCIPNIVVSTDNLVVCFTKPSQKHVAGLLHVLDGSLAHSKVIAKVSRGPERRLSALLSPSTSIRKGRNDASIKHLATPLVTNGVSKMRAARGHERIGALRERKDELLVRRPFVLVGRTFDVKEWCARESVVCRIERLEDGPVWERLIDAAWRFLEKVDVVCPYLVLEARQEAFLRVVKLFRDF